MDATDDDLVRRTVAGDTAAFDALVDRHYAPCLRFAWRQLGAREDAEEAVQDAFVRAYGALARGTQPDRFRSWLMAIVINRCRSLAAKNRRRFALLDRLRTAARANAAPVAAAPGPDGERLRAALARLSDPLREAFLLKHVDEMTYDEMSGVTGVGVSALKMRVKRAAEALTAILAIRE